MWHAWEQQAALLLRDAPAVGQPCQSFRAFAKRTFVANSFPAPRNFQLVWSNPYQKQGLHTDKMARLRPKMAPHTNKAPIWLHLLAPKSPDFCDSFACFLHPSVLFTPWPPLLAVESRPMSVAKSGRPRTSPLRKAIPTVLFGPWNVTYSKYSMSCHVAPTTCPKVNSHRCGT